MQRESSEPFDEGPGTADVQGEVPSDLQIADSPPSDAEEFPHVNLIGMALIVEGGLLALALAIGWFGFYDLPNPLSALTTADWVNGLIWGIIATVPMLGYLALMHFGPPKILKPMSDFVDEFLKPMFKDSSVLEMVIISLMAGFCEELFFRWCLQGGITSFIGGPLGIASGLLIASVVFGLCHWVNMSYGVTTIIVGIYLGGVMILTGNFLAPAIAHALYDFIAIYYIARCGRTSEDVENV